MEGNIYINSDSSEQSGKDDIKESQDEDSFFNNLQDKTKKIYKDEDKENINLLQRKRKRKENEADIIYNANTKKIENSFIPNIEELNDFLKSCTIKEINLENIAEEINQTPKEKIFDPDIFIKENYCQEEEKNYPKYNLSIEDLEYNYNNKEENFFKEQELIETKEHEGKKFLNEIFQEKNLNKQKIEIHNLIGKIKKMNIKKY